MSDTPAAPLSAIPLGEADATELDAAARKAAKKARKAAAAAAVRSGFACFICGLSPNFQIVTPATAEAVLSSSVPSALLDPPKKEKKKRKSDVAA